MAQCDRSHTSSYLSSIVMAISYIVLEIMRLVEKRHFAVRYYANAAYAVIHECDGRADGQALACPSARPSHS